MKHYDRAKKKWVTQEELDKAKKPRDKDVCKGRRPHDFVLVLPQYVKYDETYTFQAEKYYKILDELYDFTEKQHESLRKIGIDIRTWNSKPSRLFICSVCNKRKYVTPKE